MAIPRKPEKNWEGLPPNSPKRRNRLEAIIDRLLSDAAYRNRYEEAAPARGGIHRALVADGGCSPGLVWKVLGERGIRATRDGRLIFGDETG